MLLFLYLPTCTLLCMSCIYLPIASWYSYTVWILIFSHLVTQRATFPNSSTRQPTFCLNFCSLETGSHITLSSISEDNYYREFCFFVNCIFWPHNYIYFLWDKILCALLLCFLTAYYFSNDFSRKAVEMQNFPWEPDGIIQCFQRHSLKRLK